MPVVVVVGAGMAGVSCALELHGAGVDVRLLDRGRRLGGRMAARTLDGRPVDLGASYLTVRDAAFADVIRGWQDRGLARPWTEVFHVAGPDGIDGTSTGPMRWSSPRGLRSLVEDLAEGLGARYPAEVEEVSPGPLVDAEPVDAVVLAMPDPQARDLVSEVLVEEAAALEGRGWEPALALVAGWDERCWPDVDGVFVNGCDELAWIADDGRRRGDAAPVLVAHSTAGFAAGLLDEPEAALEPMLARLRSVLGIRREPRWALVKRWSLARPREGRDAPYHLGHAGVGLCGDGWHGPPRVEAAFLSGRALGRALVERLR